MLEILQTLSNEHVASIREIQANPSRALKGVTRVMNGKKTVGFFLNREAIEELIEDIQALGSKKLKQRATAARKAKTKDLIPFDQVLKGYGL